MDERIETAMSHLGALKSVEIRATNSSRPFHRDEWADEARAVLRENMETHIGAESSPKIFMRPSIACPIYRSFYHYFCCHHGIQYVANIVGRISTFQYPRETTTAVDRDLFFAQRRPIEFDLITYGSAVLLPFASPLAGATVDSRINDRAHVGSSHDGAAAGDARTPLADVAAGSNPRSVIDVKTYQWRATLTQFANGEHRRARRWMTHRNLSASAAQP
ncbi:hypothetical protein C8R45DRAFT_1222192 [Mycena sanguinolenta]|nr:hypothetical protein C8R45DRAFT_1222192 [Mycena sanguinolenta]